MLITYDLSSVERFTWISSRFSEQIFQLSDWTVFPVQTAQGVYILCLQRQSLALPASASLGAKVCTAAPFERSVFKELSCFAPAANTRKTVSPPAINSCLFCLVFRFLRQGFHM